MPWMSMAAIMEMRRPPEYAASGAKSRSPIGAHPRRGPMPGWQPVSSMKMASFASTLGWMCEKKDCLAAVSSFVNRAAASEVFF